MGHVSRLGVLGGTFDPPHAAHLSIASVARATLALNEVLFMPAGDPWRKHGLSVTSAEHRLAMVEAAVEGCEWCSVSDIEIRRAGATHTIDTLQALQSQGYREIWFLLGEDALVDLPHWHEPELLITFARLAVAARPGTRVPTRGLDQLVPGLSAAVDWLPFELDTTSASSIRADVAAGLPVADRVPQKVCSYIEKHGLYRGY